MGQHRSAACILFAFSSILANSVVCQVNYGDPFSFNSNSNARSQVARTPKPASIPQPNWSRALANQQSLNSQPRLQQSAMPRQPAEVVDRIDDPNNYISNNNKRHIIPQNSTVEGSTSASSIASGEDICADRLCYGLPMGCLGKSSLPDATSTSSPLSQCSVLVTSKRFIDPDRPISRDIMFELIASPDPMTSNYAAVGFSNDGKMAGSLVSECVQYLDPKVHIQIVKLRHSFNLGPYYDNVPVTIKSGIKNLGISFEGGRYQCRWIVESAVEFSYEAHNGTSFYQREDLGYKNYHIILASGEYDPEKDRKNYHKDRASSLTPVSLAQTGHIKSLGAHILLRIHGSLMIVIWIGLVSISIIMARYYKNEWSNSKINDLAIWFVVHRTLMMMAWFGSLIAVIFAFMYTETYHPGLHQISGSVCLFLSTAQVLGGFLRPSQDSTKRVYFNWTHFLCGNFSYLAAMVSLVTAAFLAPAHLPPLYIWVIAMFVAFYSFAHIVMTIHQFVVHRSSKISITPMSDLNSQSSATYGDACGFVDDSYHKGENSLRQFMMGMLVTIVVIFIVSLVSLVNIN